jgi:hypothetical protein
MLAVIVYVVAPCTAILGLWILLRTSYFVRDTFLRNPDAPEEKQE